MFAQETSRGLMNREFSLEVSFGTKLAVAIFARDALGLDSNHLGEDLPPGPHFPGADAERRVDEWAAWWRQLLVCTAADGHLVLDPIGLCPVDLQHELAPVYAAAVRQAKKWEADILTLGLQIASLQPRRVRPWSRLPKSVHITLIPVHPSGWTYVHRSGLILTGAGTFLSDEAQQRSWFAEQLHRWRRYGADRIR